MSEPTPSQATTGILERIQNIFPDPGAVPAAYTFSTPLIQREYLINGELRTWQGAMQDIVSPICLNQAGQITPQVIGQVPEVSAEESMAALDAALAAYDLGRGRWPTMSVADRIKHVEQFAVKMVAQRAAVVKCIIWEIGKSRDDSEKEFDRTVDYIRETIHALKDLDRSSSRFLIEQGIIGQIRRSPLGVVLCMGPYNYPLNETFATLIPALIMGNTVVIKPPKLGVLLYGPLLSAFKDAFPPGVVNTVYGDGKRTITPLMKSGHVDVLAFIGSSRVADVLKKHHPHPHKLRSVLGMGAKNAGIVLADADVDASVNECLLGSLSYNGQRCTALKILFVHKSILEAFLEKFCAGLAKLSMGMPYEAVKLTPLPVPGKAEYLTELVRDATSKGARVVNAGGGVSNHTFFYPAVVSPVDESMRLYHEEQFGPVVPIVPFDDLNHPIHWINTSHYGQQVSVFGTDPNVLAVLIDPLVNQVCRVNINSQCQRGPDSFPFTGRKGSAEGTLSITDALRAFSIRTLVAAKDTESNKAIITSIVRDHKSNFLSTDFIF